MDTASSKSSHFAVDSEEPEIPQVPSSLHHAPGNRVGEPARAIHRRETFRSGPYAFIDGQDIDPGLPAVPYDLDYLSGVALLRRGHFHDLPRQPSVPAWRCSSRLSV